MWEIEPHHVFQAVTGGVVVLVGVVVAEWLHGRRQRRERAVEAALEVAHLLPRVSTGYADLDVDTSEGSTWNQRWEQLWKATAAARAAASGFRSAKELRAELDNVLAKIGAADSVIFIDQERLPRSALADIPAPTLTRVLVPETSSLRHDVDEGRSHWGFAPLGGSRPST